LLELIQETPMSQIRISEILDYLYKG